MITMTCKHWCSETDNLSRILTMLLSLLRHPALAIFGKYCSSSLGARVPLLTPSRAVRTACDLKQRDGKLYTYWVLGSNLSQEVNSQCSFVLFHISLCNLQKWQYFLFQSYTHPYHKALF